MPAIEKIIDELQWLSDRISTQVRTLGTVLVAITWGLIIGKPELAGPIPQGIQKQLLMIGVLALGAMLIDFLQYVLAYANNKNLLGDMETQKLEKKEYDYSAVTYRLRNLCFWVKQVVLLIASLWFLILIVVLCIKVLLSNTTCTPPCDV